MELFERIDHVAKIKAGSRSRLAKLLEVPQTTFNGYFSSKGQGKISAVLIERILAIYPEVCPEWLVTGRGEMESVKVPTGGQAPDLGQLEARERILDKYVSEHGPEKGVEMARLVLGEGV